MENQRELDTGKWDDFLGNWLKANHIKVWPARIPVIGVKADIDKDDKVHLVFDVELNQKKMKWEANKTNVDILREHIQTGPKDLIGKVLVFIKHKVRNPATNQMVDSLLVDKVE